MRELSAAVLRQMTLSILGLADAAGSTGTKTNAKHVAAVRSQALQFAVDVAR